MTPIRTALLSAAVAAAAPALVAAAAAAAPAPPAASAWTLSADGGTRQCRLVLHPAAGGAGNPVAMPVGCRRAFPALARVALWSEAGDGLHLDDARGDPLLAFDADGKGFRGTSPQGEALALTPADGRGRAALDAAAGPVAAEVAQGGTPKTAAPKKAAGAGPKPADVAGHYAVLRDRTRDTGCMVTLDDKAAGPGSTLKARLAPACRDQGIVIFDPVGWRLVGGRLVLTARKGHTTELDTQEDGSWMNDAKAGKTLSLKRI